MDPRPQPLITPGTRRRLARLTVKLLAKRNTNSTRRAHWHKFVLAGHSENVHRSEICCRSADVLLLLLVSCVQSHNTHDSVLLRISVQGSHADPSDAGTGAQIQLESGRVTNPVCDLACQHLPTCCVTTSWLLTDYLERCSDSQGTKDMRRSAVGLAACCKAQRSSTVCVAASR